MALYDLNDVTKAWVRIPSRGLRFACTFVLKKHIIAFIPCWQIRRDVEGALFLLRRSSNPTFQFTILNRKSQSELNAMAVRYAAGNAMLIASCIHCSCHTTDCCFVVAIGLGNYHEEVHAGFDFEEQNDKYMLYTNAQRQVPAQILLTCADDSTI